MNPESQQQILDLVEIYRCILSLENTEVQTSDTSNTVRTQIYDDITENGLDACKTIKHQTSVIDQVENVQDADDEHEDEDEECPVEKELAISGCCVENTDFSIPDVIPNQDLGTREQIQLPDLIPRSQIRVSRNQRFIRPSRFMIQGWSRERGRDQEDQEDQEETAPIDWRLYGRQLDLISSTFSMGRGPSPAARGPIDLRGPADDLPGGQHVLEAGLNLQMLRSNRKFLSNLAMSVVANTVVYLCIRKIKRLLF